MYSRFLAILKSKNLTPYKVAKETGISQATLTAWKNGTYVPKYDKLKKIASYLGINVSDLFESNAQSKEMLPIVGQIACGSPILAEENIEGYAPKCHGTRADFCLYAKGDSMIGARIFDGDLVFIRQQSMVENGESGAVLIDESATLKRIYYYPDQNKLILSPENPKYAPLVYVGNELDGIKILGKAVAFLGNL